MTSPPLPGPATIDKAPLSGCMTASYWDLSSSLSLSSKLSKRSACSMRPSLVASDASREKVEDLCERKSAGERTRGRARPQVRFTSDDVTLALASVGASQNGQAQAIMTLYSPSRQRCSPITKIEARTNFIAAPSRQPIHHLYNTLTHSLLLLAVSIVRHHLRFVRFVPGLAKDGS